MSIYLNDRVVPFTQYPNGESCIPILKPSVPGARYDVRLHWESDQDLINLMFLSKVIRAEYQGMLGNPPMNLFIDYMPYSRMDRAQDGHCFSLKHVADFINTVGFETIEVVEPHSQVTLDLLNRSRPVWATAKLAPVAMHWMAFDKKRDFLVLPDAGAYKRYSEIMGDVLSKCHVAVLKKKRDFETGKIQGLEIDYLVTRGKSQGGYGAKALIIDDLSSRGGTFVGAADLLREALGFTYVALLVTHMEPAGLNVNMRTKLDRVFCTDTITFPRPAPSNFEIFQRSHWL